MAKTKPFYEMTVGDIRLIGTVLTMGPWLVAYRSGIEIGHLPLGRKPRLFRVKVCRERYGRMSPRGAWWVCDEHVGDHLIGPFTAVQARRIAKAFGVAFGGEWPVGWSGGFSQSPAWQALVEGVASNPRILDRCRGVQSYLPRWTEVVTAAAAELKRAA